jgi:hypothetical protein
VTENPRPTPLIGSLNIYGVLALAGIVGPIVLVASDIVAVFSASSYNLLRDSISSLAWTPLGWIQQIGFLTLGLLVEVFTAGLLFSIKGGGWFRLGIVFLACFGFGLLLIGAFRVNQAGVSPTIRGTIHTVTATTIFLLFRSNSK